MIYYHRKFGKGGKDMENKDKKQYSSMKFCVKKFNEKEDVVRLSGLGDDPVNPGSIVDVGGGDGGVAPPQGPSGV